jgi:TATA-binding protein-associated factor
MEEDSNPPTCPEFPKFSVQELVAQGNLLLASSGKEFIKPTGILPTAQEVMKARKEAMNRLGLGFLDTVDDDMELEKEFAAEMDVDTPEDAPVMENQVDSQSQAAMDLCQLDTSVNKDNSPSTRSATPIAIPSPYDTDVPAEIDTGQLSARERNRLKRKRKPGKSAFVAPPPQTAGSKYATAPAGSSNK